MLYLLDTDHSSALQRRTTGYAALQTRLRSIAPDDYGTTIATYEEQCRGWLDKIHRSKTSQARVIAYSDLKANLLFFSGLAVWEYSDAADQFYFSLVKAKINVGTKDLRIASIALANGATVLTRNTRDFPRIPGLLYADWTI